MSTDYTATNIGSGVAQQTTMNAEWAAIQTALERMLNIYGDSTNGTNALQTTLDMNSNKILNVPAPTLTGDLVRLGDLSTADAATAITTTIIDAVGKYSSNNVEGALAEIATAIEITSGALVYATAGGTADAITASLSLAPTAYTNGMQLRIRASGANTVTTPTIDIDGLGAKTITKYGNQALSAGDIPRANYEMVLRYNSSTSKFELINPGLEDQLSLTAVGSRLMVWLRSATGAVSRTLYAWLNYQTINVFDFMTTAEIADVEARTFGVDVTTACRAALAAKTTGIKVVFPDGGYNITDNLPLLSKTTVKLSSAVEIRQATTDKEIFIATAKDKVWIDAPGAVLFGEGTWSAGWTGNSGHGDRVIHLIGCTNSGVAKPIIRNGGNAGIAIVGGTNITIDMPTIEGTHTHGQVIPALGNFQNGMYIKHDSVYGVIKNLRVNMPDISGCAQGILIEGYGGLSQTDDMIITIANPVIHDIPGQHGIYCQLGKVNIIAPMIDNCDLDGIKIQDNGTVQPTGVNIPDFNISNCGSHAIEIQAAAAGGAVTSVKANGIAIDCQRGLGVNAETATSTVADIDIDMISRNATHHGAIIQGDNAATVRNINLDIDSLGSGRHGVYVTARACTEVTIRPKIRDSGSLAANTYDGIFIENGAEVFLIDPDVTDSGGNQRYAFYSAQVIGNGVSSVYVRGKAIFQDGTTHDVRASQTLVEWPVDVTLSSGTTVSRMQDLKRFSKTKTHTIATNQSTSATNVTLWQSEMPDESAWYLKAEVVAKLSDSTDREAWTKSVICYRDAGGNVTIDVQNDIDNIGASAAALTWEASGTTIRLRANSGGATTYDWKAKVSYIDLP